MKNRAPKPRRARPLLVATGAVAIQLAGCGDDQPAEKADAPIFGVIVHPDAATPDAPPLPPDAVFGVVLRPDGKV